ncbi:MAG: ROK family protein [Elusimicrobia bacterium]|nr:ROK family protein [Elusimicrobiota bacterium]
MKKNKEVLAIDIGGTKTYVAVVDVDFKVKKKQEFETPVEKEKFISVLREQIAGIDPDKKFPVGIAMCGLLSIDARRIILAPNLGWRDLPIREFFSPLDRTFAIANDGTVAAWGSYITENEEDYSRILTVTLGTGVGGGLVLDDYLLFGAGELGHIKIDADGPVCGCGSRGCLEAFVGGKHIAKRVKEWCGLEVENAKQLFELAEKGNADAVKSWEKIGRILGYALSSVVNLNGVQAIIIGGKISRASRYFVEELKRTLQENVLGSALQNTAVKISKWGNELSLIGAAAVALKPVPQYNTSGKELR